MKASIIIPAFGKETLLEKCLVSLKKDIQGNYDYDVWVIDDGSGLDKDKIEKNVLPDYKLEWRHFSSPKSRSAARNEGIKNSDGDIIIFLDADMETFPEFVSSHIQSHADNQRSAVTGKIKWPENGSFYRYIGSRGAEKKKDGDNIPPWYFVTGNASLKRTHIMDAGLFDETLTGWGGEDLELGMRLSKKGIGFIYNENAVSFHHYDGTLSGHLERTEAYGRDTVPILTDRYPELMKILRLDLLDNVFFRLATMKCLYSFIRFFAIITDRFYVPDIAFDYLTFAAYSNGWMKRKKV